ncbi:MAG TPA: hypothetical protein ENK46_02370 [Flavobacteriia bacterium]|nr:hypothetical protein [Flavobacteriia bacterium]
MKNFLIVTCLLYSMQLFPQLLSSGSLRPTQVVDSNRFNDVWELRFSKQKPTKLEINGSVYLFDSWKEIGTLYLDEKRYTLTDINYNALYDRFEFKISKDSVLVFDNMDSIQIKNKKFKRFYFDANKGQRYAEVLFKGQNYTLIKEFTAKFIEATPNPLMLKNNGHKYVLVEKYYVKNNKTNNLSPLKKSKKEIIRLFSDRGEDVKAYLKENKLSYKKENDLVKIFEHYDVVL